MDAEKQALTSSLVFAIKLAVILLLVQIFQTFTGIDLGGFGVFPRNRYGLMGILLGPLVHGSWGHLFSNLPPLMVTVFLIHFFYRKYFWRIFISCYLLTGLAVWVFSREVYHIGISGVVYALVSFLFFAGIFVRNLISIVLSLLVLLLYSGMVAGVLPTEDILSRNISWESHLLGAIAGVVIAWVFRKPLIDEGRRRNPPPPPEAPEEKKYFFDPDVFERTKWERRADDEQQLF